jgi:hypothetical protein
VSEGIAGTLAYASGFQGIESAVNNGLRWLVQQVEAGGLYNPSPIGFYFAKLWYYEKLYPIIFTVAALGRARRRQTNYLVQDNGSGCNS